MAESAGVWPTLFLALGFTALGAMSALAYDYFRVTQIQEEKLKLSDKYDALVRDHERIKGQRDAAIAVSKKERQEIYDKDEEAARWGSAPVPKSLSTRVRESAESSERASRGSHSLGSGLPESP